MSFLARRVAASEGAFFSQTSKEAIARLREKAANSTSPISGESSTNASISAIKDKETSSDVLPEILQHSLPEQQQYDGLLPSSFSPSPSSLASLAFAKSSSSVSQRPMDTNALAFLPTLPQTSFGPRRWTPPQDEVKILASTANEARLEGMPTMDDARAKALLEGYGVVGGATVGIAIVVSKLQIHSLDDVRIKGYEHMQPRVESIRRRFEPWRQWVKSRNKSERAAVGASFAQALGLKQLVEEER